MSTVSEAYRRGRADAMALLWTNLAALDAAPHPRSVLARAIDRTALGELWDANEGWRYEPPTLPADLAVSDSGHPQVPPQEKR